MKLHPINTKAVEESRDFSQIELRKNETNSVADLIVYADMEIKEYLPALALGFFGGFHCVGMCGGFVASFSLARGNVWMPGMIAYQGSRILTYLVLGVVTALIGRIVVESGAFSNGQRIVSLIAGSIMLILALQIGGIISEWFSFSPSSSNMFSNAYKKAVKGDNAFAWVPFGILNGLLPCGLVYSALALSLDSANALKGGLMMLAFGAGTIPWLLGVGWLMKSITPAVRLGFTRMAAFAIAVYGIFLIYKSSSHWTHSMMDM